LNDPEHSLRFSWLLLSQIIVCSQKQHVVESGLSEAEGTIDFLIAYLKWYHTLQVKFDLLVYFSYFFLVMCLNISTIINIKILANSNQQTQSYKFTSHIAAFLSVVLITEMLEICIQISYDKNVQLILKSYLPEVYGTTLIRDDTCRKLI
jgi:hypothetical protein